MPKINKVVATVWYNKKNMHALRQVFLSRGGASFHTPYYTGLQVAAFAMGETPLEEFQFAWEVGGVRI